MNAPYLSIVCCGSNAGYGGDFLDRVQNFADNLFTLAEKSRLNAELVFVEWNPPKDRPGISDAIIWKPTIPTRIITVPKEVHDRIPNPHNERFFEYIAKNVGIRRSAGRFVLSTNPDNLYSSELIDRLADHNLDYSCFYRVNRHDIKDGKVFAVHLAYGSIIDGKLQESDRTVPDGNFFYTGLGTLPTLHFNAAGDFTLMARSRWEEIKGNPEVSYSLTVDGQTVYLAAKHGLRQVILDEPMYHQDHSRSEKWYPPWTDRVPYAEKQNSDDWGLKDVPLHTMFLN